MRTSGKCRTRPVYLLGFALGTVLCLPGQLAHSTAHASESPSESPLSQPAFSASPAELLECAKKCDYDLGTADVDLLLDEVRYCIDAEGRLTTLAHQIYRCLTRDAFDERGVVHAPWSPWYQDRPEIQARVITSDGEAHTLDQQTIEEIQVPSGQAYVFTDAKLLRAPLPALAVGCIVETQVLTREYRPFSTAGTSGSCQLGSLLAPARLLNIVLEAPASMTLTYRVLRSDVVPVAKREGDRQIVTVSLGPVPALLEQLEGNLPSDLAPVPMFAFSTGTSWHDVAQEYAAIVQQQLTGSGVEEVVRSVLGSGQGKQAGEVAALLLEHVKQRYRYTAVSFGSATIVPKKPAETLARQYGDCKDLATLYVGLLRAAGLPADVALLSSGLGMDVIPDLPGLSGFNHAIVCVPGDTPLWIDPTSTFTPFGELPAEDQGRLALVASDTTGELVRTPRTTSSENGVTAQQVMTISESSPAKIATVTTYRGAFAPPVRESFASANQKQQRDYLRQQGLVRYGTDKLVDFSCTRPDDLKSPFQVKADYDETPLVTVAHPQALAIVPLYEPVDWMPFDLTGPADSSQVASPEEGTGSKDQRDLPLVLPFAVRYESEYRVVPPVGYVPVNVPPGQTVELGPARLEVTLRAEDDHSVTVRVLFDGGDAGFSAAAVRESRHKIEALGGGRGYQAWQTAINFEHTAGKHLEAGRLREAVVGYHALLQQYPEESIRHIQFAHAVLRLGLGDLARQHARRAVELAPAEFHAWYTLGLVLSHDRIGQQMAPGFDRAGAEAAYRKALEIEPDDATTRWDLGTLLEYDEQGHLFGNPTFTDAAIVELTAAYEQRKYEDLLDGLVSAMYIQGRKAEARKLIEQVSPCPTRDLHLLVAVATTEGVDACLQRAAEMQPVGAQRQQLLRQLLVALSYFREYQTVGALAQQLAVNSPQEDTFLRFANEARWFSRYRPEDESTDDPVGLVRRVVADALVYGTASSRLKRYFANVPDSAEFAFDCGVPCWMESFRREPLNSGFSRDRRADSVTEFNFEAVAAGADAYRVLVEHKMFPHLSWTAYVLRGAQGLQLYRAGHRQAEFGRLALELLAAGREDDARRWLNWAYERQRQDVGALARLFDQFAGTPFVRLWTVANKDTRDVQLAAAALAASGESPEQSLAILSANRADLDAHKQLQVDRAVAAGYAETGDYQKLLALAAAIRQRHPKAFEPIAMELRARSRLQDLDAIEKIVGENADVEEVRTLGQVALAEAATAVGNTGKATELLALLARQQDQLPPWLLSHVARLSLFQDPVPEGTLALATGALERTPDAEPEEQAQAERAAHFSYVLALIEAGQLLEAVQALHAIPAIDPDSRPNSFDKLALGWIADKCGLPEHAAKLFGEVQPSKNAQPCAVFDLARKRLQRMANQADEDRDRPPPDGAPGSL